MKLATGESPFDGAAEFLAWHEDPAPSTAAKRKRRSNVYRHTNGARQVNIRLGSITSIEGETHDATLVLETFWDEHDLARLLDWLTGAECGWSSGARQKTRLKTHYVAMTRPKRLLCLAMPVKSLGGDPDPLIKQLELRGWQVEPVQ